MANRSAACWLLPALVLLSSAAAASGSSVLAGGAGWGLAFSAQRADVALADWGETSPLGAGLTVEMWVQRLDKHTVSSPLTVSSWDAAAGGANRELALLMIGEYGVWRATLGGDVFHCPRANCSFGFDYSHAWHHVAMSHDPVSGAVRMYRDGALVSDSAALEPPQLQNRPPQLGLLLLGQFMQVSPDPP